ncbi:MAG TPA: oligosaccharide flippase family protein [Capillimicrobium sp.]|nr:oligosaccharide flippase family protein [Capillimicrobium sp.]
MRSVSSGAVLMGVSQVVTALTGFATTIVVARVLGPDGVGAYTIALSLLLILGMVASLGLENGIAWSVASGRWRPRDAFAQSQLAAIALGAAGVGLSVLLAILAPDAFGGLSVGLVALAAAGLPFLISWQYARWLAVALDRYEAFVLPPALVSTLALVGCGAGALVADTTGMLVGLLAAYALTAAVSVVDGLRHLRDRDREPDRAADAPHGAEPLREATAFGLRANAGTALQFLNYRVDLFVLSAVVTSAELGRYSAAVSVTGVMFLAPQTLAYVIFPRVAALSAGGDEALEQRNMVEEKSLRHVSLLTLVSLPIVAAGMAVGIPLLYGSEFDGAIGLGLILLPGVALFGIAAVLSATINGRGFPQYSLRSAVISTPVALVLYAALIPTLGDVGAALASTASYAFNFAVTAVYYRRATGARVLPLLVPTRDEVADVLALARR